jgi:hypothetical protein
LSIETGLVLGETSADLKQRRDEMEKIWDVVRQWLRRMTAPSACVEIIECMSPRERADLPSFHPRYEPLRPQDTERC